MAKKSRLQIPHPTARPGEEPDFSYLDLSPAGAVDKPPLDADLRDIEHLSSGLVRVLDDDHTAKGQWNPNFDAEQLQVGLRWMLLNRVFDEREPVFVAVRISSKVRSGVICVPQVFWLKNNGSTEIH